MLRSGSFWKLGPIGIQQRFHTRMAVTNVQLQVKYVRVL